MIVNLSGIPDIGLLARSISWQLPGFSAYSNQICS